MFDEFFSLFLLYLVIFDPFMSTATFLSLTKNLANQQKRSIAIQTTLIAAILIAIFVFFGYGALDMLSVKMQDFKIAGGLVLAILGIQMVLGMGFSSDKPRAQSAIATVIATPLITGPAAIMATIISTTEYGQPLVILSSGAALVIVFLGLYFANTVVKFTGQSSLAVLSTIFGLVTVAWGVSFIRQGILGI